jgi:sterol carrier protein 2
MARGTTNAYVLGVGLTQFIKPRRTREYPELGFEAGAKAMLDAKITVSDVSLVGLIALTLTVRRC